MSVKGTRSEVDVGICTSEVDVGICTSEVDVGICRDMKGVEGDGGTAYEVIEWKTSGRRQEGIR